MYRILSLDGGGIRGLLTARILERLVEAVPDALAHVDLFAGTSSGAIISGALAIGKSPTALVDLFQNRSAEIFHRDFLEIVGKYGILESRYDSQHRFNVLHSVFADIQLKDVPRNILIPAFQLDGDNAISPREPNDPNTWRPKFFHNFPYDNAATIVNNLDLEQKLVDVTMRSSAAPTFFPIYQGYIDGAVAVNNPSSTAFAQAMNKATGGQTSIDAIRLLSIGTGTVNESLTERDSAWGLAEWNVKLLDILMDGSDEIAHYQCRQLLGAQYVRIQPDLRTNIAIDDRSSIPALLKIANGADIRAAVALISSSDWLGTPAVKR